jgi:hypothetical protein
MDMIVVKLFLKSKAGCTSFLNKSSVSSINILAGRAAMGAARKLPSSTNHKAEVVWQ